MLNPQSRRIGFGVAPVLCTRSRVPGANFKVVTNLYAREQYVLTHCGSEAPTTTEVTEEQPERSGGCWSSLIS